MKACKADIIETYKEQLCTESLEALEKAKTPDELVSILHKFATYLHYKTLPDVEFGRKWFGNELDLLNRNGIYLDQILHVKDPEQKSLIMFGDCHITLMLTKPSIWNVSLQDDSSLSLLTYGTCSAIVREKGSGHTKILHKNPQSVIKIRKI
ncbi:MAG: hypothetical protein J5733_05360 [Bacteroidaceae bacterium]|nr:hypothetical protein [Bacteroidaceae bacterium]